MAVYYKFKSAKEYNTMKIEGHFVSVSILKQKIFETKKYGQGSDFNLVISNAQTNQEYLGEDTLIPQNTSVLVRRIPGQPRLRGVVNRIEPKVENNVEREQPAKISPPLVIRYPQETEGDDFGDDLYTTPDIPPVQSNKMVLDTLSSDKADEDSKIKALVDSSAALDWQMKPQDINRGFGKGMGGRMNGGRGFGQFGFERKTPPQGYVCHRCNAPGHFIQHCPTNGDPIYDRRGVRNPTGISGGEVAVLKPNETAFDRVVEGLSSSGRSGCELPPELHCPLCKEVMKDAMMASKCCFNSFCDKCIRNHIISKAACVCGARNILADDLLPNRTVRDTIDRILESINNSSGNAGSVVQIQDTESAHRDMPKAPSPSISAASKSGGIPPSVKKDNPEMEAANGGQPVANPTHQSLEKSSIAKDVDLSEVTLDVICEKEPKLQGSALRAEEEVQQKLPTAEAGKKKKKKTPFPVNAAELQWRVSQNFAAENYMMPPAHSAYNPYWSGVQIGMDGYMVPPYPVAMPYMGYAPGPFDVPLGGVFPQNPFGGQRYPMPALPPQRDQSFNPMPSRMIREEPEARKADIKRKRENDRHGQSRECIDDWECRRELSNNVEISSQKSKSRIMPQETSHNNQIKDTHVRQRLPRETEYARQGKNRADHYQDKESEEYAYRIGVQGDDKRRKSNNYKDSDLPASSAHHKPLSHDNSKTTYSSGRGTKGVAMAELDSSDEEEERHFKRKRRTSYEPEEVRSIRSSRERPRERGRDYERDYERSQGLRQSCR